MEMFPNIADVYGKMNQEMSPETSIVIIDVLYRAAALQPYFYIYNLVSLRLCVSERLNGHPRSTSRYKGLNACLKTMGD